MISIGNRPVLISCVPILQASYRRTARRTHSWRSWSGAPRRCSCPAGRRAIAPWCAESKGKAGSIKTTYLESKGVGIRELGPDKKPPYLSRYEELRNESGVDLKLRIPSSNLHHSRCSTPHIEKDVDLFVGTQLPNPDRLGFQACRFNGSRKTGAVHRLFVSLFSASQ